MSLERVRLLIQRYRERVSGRAARAPASARWTAEPEVGVQLLESMLLSRQLDAAAHELRASGHGHYTIASSGHEANAVLGRLTLPSDPSLVHYRSAALQIERARHRPGNDPVRDIALSLVAARDEPTSGGRHKVLGHPDLGLVPQTSTIASHLPRAVGFAFALERIPRLETHLSEAPDAIAMASFGDASLNHSTALGALNAASWVVHQNMKLPLLAVCEDNGLGISVRTPGRWIETRARALPHFEYFRADGADLSEVWHVAGRAVRFCREQRRPAFLHLICHRLLGHAGSDADISYRTREEIDSAIDSDPVTSAALLLIDSGVLTVDAALELDLEAERRVRAEAEEARRAPRLTTREEVMEALVAPAGENVEREAARDLRCDESTPLTLARGINAALKEALAKYPEALVFGEDVAKKGGVYGVTKGLLAEAGPKRVFNTLLDEQTILGLALGCAARGLLPIPEIQYLAYLHNAEDQLRGEAATFRFFSGGRAENPMVVRVAGLAYQRGFGGHFHNDNSIAVLRDVPGLVIAVPSRADDAIALLRTSLALARAAARVVVMVEPIALYHTRDLHEEGDGAWLAAPPNRHAPFGAPRVYRSTARDLVIATYGNGTYLGLRAARRLEAHGVAARVLDLRWLAPLPVDAVSRHARETGRLLVVDECRVTGGGPSEALGSAVAESGAPVRFARVAAADSFVPLGEAATTVLVSEDEIVEAALRLVR